MPAIPSNSETNRESPPILAVFETRVTVSTQPAPLTISRRTATSSEGSARTRSSISGRLDQRCGIT